MGDSVSTERSRGDDDDICVVAEEEEEEICVRGGANTCVGFGVERYKSGPESGRKSFRGFSAYIRASKACPTRGISA